MLLLFKRLSGRAKKKLGRTQNKRTKWIPRSITNKCSWGFLFFRAVFHHAVVQRIAQKCPDQFVSAAVRLGGDFIDPGDNFFPDADGKDFVAILSFGSFRLDKYTKSEGVVFVPLIWCTVFDVEFVFFLGEY